MRVLGFVQNLHTDDFETITHTKSVFIHAKSVSITICIVHIDLLLATGAQKSWTNTVLSRLPLTILRALTCKQTI